MTLTPQYLFLPHAGGSAADLLHFAKLLCQSDQRHLLELPGRGRRRRDPLVFEAKTALDDLEAVITARFEKAGVSPQAPVLFFGHSFGGYLAWMLARRHRRKNVDARVLVVALSNEPLHLRRNFNSHRASDVSEAADTSHLVNFVATLGGVPDQVRSAPELLDRFYPLLRADLSVADGLPFDIDELRDALSLITGQGEDDPIQQDREKWAEITTGPHEHLVLPGGHFVVVDSDVALARAIQATSLYQNWKTAA